MEPVAQSPNFASDPGSKIPKKIEGKHRWFMLATFALNDQQASNVMRGNRVKMDDSNNIGKQIACADCQQPYVAVKDFPCTMGDKITGG